MTRKHLLILAGILAFAAAIRTVDLGSRSLWLDEIMSVRRVRGSFLQMLREVTGIRPEPDRKGSGDAHPPLYYIAQHLAKPLGQGDGAARVPAAIFGIAAVGVVFLLGRELLGPVGGLIAAGLSAASTFQIYYSQEARLYSLAMLLAALSLWLFARLLPRPGGVPPRRRVLLWIAYTGVGVLSLYTCYYLAFALFAEGAALAVLARDDRRFAIRWLASRAVVAALFAPYVAVVLQRMAGLPPAPEQSRLEVLKALPFSLAAIVGGQSWISARLASIPLIGLLAPAVFGLVALRRNRRALVMLAAAIAVPAILVVVLPWRLQIFEPKHLAFIAPALAVAAAAMLREFRADWPALVVTGVLVFANMLTYSRYAGSGPQSIKETWPEICATVHQGAKPGDAILFNPGYLGYAFTHYYGDWGQLALVQDPQSFEPADPRVTRLWVVQPVWSRVAFADPVVSEKIDAAFRPAVIDFFGETRRGFVMFPGRMSALVLFLYERPADTIRQH